MSRIRNFAILFFVLFVLCFQILSDKALAGGSDKFIKKSDLKQLKLNNMYPDNYLFNCLRNGQLWRWHHSSFPLKVYIVKNDEFPSYYDDNIRKAFQTWQSASSGVVSFKFIDNPKDADIIVCFEDIKDTTVTSKTLGITHTNMSNNRLFLPVKIQLRPYSINTVYISYARSYSVDLHEIGHALGLGHSKNPIDIMYYTTYTTNGELSTGDINTLKFLYSVIPDVCDKPYDTQYQSDYAMSSDIFRN